MARSFTAASSQYISVPSAPSINFGSGDFTVAAWVRFPVEPPNASMIVGKRAGGFDGDEGWELKFNDGGNETVRWDVETDITGRVRAEATLTNITDGNWHYIAADHTDGAPTGQIRLWYDGAIAATSVANTPGTVDTATPLVIAAAYNTPNTNFLTGYVAEVWGCRKILTLGQHQALAKGFSPLFLSTLPCFYMQLIGRASPEPDRMNGLLGTLGGAPPWVEHPRVIFPVPGQIGQDLWYEDIAVEIDGQSSYVADIVRARDGAVTINGQSNVVADIKPIANAAVAIIGQSTVVADIEADAAIAVQIDAQSNVVADVSITANVGTIPIQGQSNVTVSAGVIKTFATTIAGQSTVVADIEAVVPVATQIDGQSSVAANILKLRNLAVQIDGQSAVTIDTAIDAAMAVEIDAEGTLTGVLAATVPVAAQIDGQGDLSATPGAVRNVATAIAGASTITADFVRARDGATTIAGQSTLTANGFIDVPIAVEIAGQSTVTANLAADAPLAVQIDGQSELTARPEFPGRPISTAVGGFVRWLFTAGGRISRDV